MAIPASALRHRARPFPALPPQRLDFLISPLLNPNLNVAEIECITEIGVSPTTHNAAAVFQPDDLISAVGDVPRIPSAPPLIQFT